MDVFQFVDKDYQDRKDREGYISYHWYRAVNSDGLTVTFRFPKGGDPTRFREYVRELQVTDIKGPFRTRKAAHTAT